MVMCTHLASFSRLACSVLVNFLVNILVIVPFRRLEHARIAMFQLILVALLVALDTFFIPIPPLVFVLLLGGVVTRLPAMSTATGTAIVVV